jgi:HNH endonuclease
MKKCNSQNCKNLVKNSYQLCYDCNQKLDTSTNASTDYKKDSIPKTVRNCLWINYFKENQREGKCQCCLRETISISNFHAGHIQAEINGGKTTLENLKPICQLCNSSMAKHNMDDFIKKYNLHHGLSSSSII